MDQDRFGPMDQEKYDGADYVCDSCGSEIMVKHTGYPEKIVSETYDFMVKECIWDANSGLSPDRVKFTADLMTRVGNIEQGKTPTYEDVTELSFAKKAIADLGEWKGPVCPSAAF